MELLLITRCQGGQNGMIEMVELEGPSSLFMAVLSFRIQIDSLISQAFGSKSLYIILMFSQSIIRSVIADFLNSVLYDFLLKSCERYIPFIIHILLMFVQSVPKISILKLYKSVVHSNEPHKCQHKIMYFIKFINSDNVFH